MLGRDYFIAHDPELHIMSSTPFHLLVTAAFTSLRVRVGKLMGILGPECFFVTEDHNDETAQVN